MPMAQTRPRSRRRAGRAARRPSRGRILIVIQNLPLARDRRVRLQCRTLLDAGFGVSVICPADGGRAGSALVEGVWVHSYRAPRERPSAAGFCYEFAYCWLRTALLVVRVACREGFDAIQACNPPDTYFLLGRLARAFGKRFVFDHHDLCPELYRSKFTEPTPALLRLLHSLEVATFRTADHVIATNESYRAIALERGGRGPDDVTVVRSGPDIDALQPGPSRTGLRRGRDHLCCWLGVMGTQDGVDLLLEAVAVVVKEMGRTDIHFALLGSGPCYEELREQAARLGLAPFVTFTGWADDTTIRDYLSTADVGLAPDPRSEFNDRSTMNKVIEYMSFGLAVVSFDLPESIVSAGEASAYVEGDDVTAFAKAIVEVVDDPERRALMGATGRRRVERALSWNAQSPTYLGVYERVLGSPVPGDHSVRVPAGS